MSANEIANRIEAIAWVRNGPNPGEGGSETPIQYFRSQNGFEDKLGVIGAEGATPTLLLLLDRAYVRAETAVFGFIPTTADVYDRFDDDPELASYPASPMFQLQIVAADRRIWLDPTFVVPTDPYEAVKLYETYDALLVTPLGYTEGPGSLFADFCVGVVRTQKKLGTTEYIVIEEP